MKTLQLILIVAALILALLAAFGVNSPRVNLIAASLACYYGSLLC